MRSEERRWHEWTNRDVAWTRRGQNDERKDVRIGLMLILLVRRGLFVASAQAPSSF
jgi:hypothetical protein